MSVPAPKRHRCRHLSVFLMQRSRRPRFIVQCNNCEITYRGDKLTDLPLWAQRELQLAGWIKPSERSRSGKCCTYWTSCTPPVPTMHK